MNDAPAVATPLPDQSATEDSLFSFAVPAGTFTDPDAGDALTLSAALEDGRPLPVWLSFDPATGSFTGTPTNADVGSLALRVSATDEAGASAFDVFTLTVANVNDAPVTVVPVSDQSATAGQPFSFALPAGTFTDPDAGDTVTLSASLADGSDLPAWLSFDPATGVFAGTPGSGDVGDLDIRVAARDTGDLVVADTFTLTIGAAGVNMIIGTSSMDTLVGTASADHIEGLDGNDTLDGAAGDDVIIGGNHWDDLYGGAGDDTFVIEGALEGNDTVSGGDGFDRLIGGVGNDTLALYDFQGENTVELIDGGAGANRILGSPYVDTLDFSQTTLANIASIDGGEGNDTITGSSGDDTLIGGPGWDGLYGNAGDDTFVVEGTLYGHDTVNGGEGFDRLLGGSGDDVLKLATFGGENTVDLIDGGAGTNRILGSPYADTLDFSQTTLANVASIDGGEGNDTITGSSGDDAIRGGQGTDMLAGGLGNDTYCVRSGDGFDWIEETDQSLANRDTLVFEDHFLADVNVTREGNHLRLGLSASNAVYLADWFLGSRLERFSFADGETLTDAEIEALLDATGPGFVQGTTGNDYVRTDGADNVLLGRAGDDELDGAEGDDRLYGGLGTDTLWGDTGADTLVGGPGNDALWGGLGDDTYVFDYGDGQDVIQDYDTTAGNQDTLRLGPGITAANLSIAGLNDQLVVRLNGTGDQVTVTDWFDDDSSDYRIERLVFADGTEMALSSRADLVNTLTGTAADDYLAGHDEPNVVEGCGGDDELVGNGGDDRLIGGTGQDILFGDTGADTYVFNPGDGQDLIIDHDPTPGVTDTLELGASPLELTFARDGDDLVVRLHGGTGQVTVQGSYAGPEHALEVFQASGQTLLNTQVDQLIQAMAQFSANNGGITWDQAIDQRPEDVQTVLASYWQPSAG